VRWFGKSARANLCLAAGVAGRGDRSPIASVVIRLHTFADAAIESHMGPVGRQLEGIAQ